MASARSTPIATTHRIGDQLPYFHPKVSALARSGGASCSPRLRRAVRGAILAAAGFEIWIGFTTAIAAPALAYLAYLQAESTLVAYNRAAGKLEALRRTGWRGRLSGATAKP